MYVFWKSQEFLPANAVHYKTAETGVAIGDKNNMFSVTQLGHTDTYNNSCVRPTACLEHSNSKITLESTVRGREKPTGSLILENKNPLEFEATAHALAVIQAKETRLQDSPHQTAPVRTKRTVKC